MFNLKAANPTIVLAFWLAVGNTVKAIPNLQTLSARSLQQFSFQYVWNGTEYGCCPMGLGGCGAVAGTGDIQLSATGADGTSQSASLTYPNGFPDGFDNTLKCDNGGNLCWTATPDSDILTGSVCVHFNGDYSCEDYSAHPVQMGE